MSEVWGPTCPLAGNPAPTHCCPVKGVAKDPEGAGRGKTRLLVLPACHACLAGSRPMTGPDGGHVAVTRVEETTKVLNPARGSLATSKEQGGLGWVLGAGRPPVSTLVPLQRPDPRSLALGEGREETFGDSSLTLQGFFGSG